MPNELTVSEEVKESLREEDFYRSCRRPTKSPHYVKVVTEFNTHELRITEFATSGDWASFKGEDKKGRLFEGRYDFKKEKGSIKWSLAEELLDAKTIVDGPHDDGLVDSLKGVRFFKHFENSALGHPPVRFTFSDYSYCDLKVEELIKIGDHKFAFAGSCGSPGFGLCGIYKTNPKDGSKTGFVVSRPKKKKSTSNT